MRKREWFDDDAFWRELYPFIFPDRRFAEAPAEVEKALALTKPAGKRALDLCCGPGRCSSALAGRGYAVTGVDRTRFLLARAGARARRAGWSRRGVRKQKSSGGACGGGARPRGGRPRRPGDPAHPARLPRRHVPYLPAAPAGPHPRSRAARRPAAGRRGAVARRSPGLDSGRRSGGRDGLAAPWRGARRPEARRQGPEARGQRSEVGDQRSQNRRNP